MLKKIKPGLPAVFAVLLSLSLATAPLAAQMSNHLILVKRGYLNQINYFTGDPIIFIREGNNYAEETYLQGIGTDYIVTGGETVPLKTISHIIRVRTGFNFRSSGKALLVAAPGYLVIGAVNSLFQGVSPVPSVTNLVVAGSFLTAGLIVPKFQVRKYSLGRRFSLKIVQSDPFLIR